MTGIPMMNHASIPGRIMRGCAIRGDEAKRYAVLVFAVIQLSLTVSPVPIRAQAFEVRTYLDIGTSWLLKPDASQSRLMGPFVREESRFLKDEIHYVKSFAGVRAKLTSWLRTALYYARKDFPGSNRQRAHMAVFDVFGNQSLGFLKISDKNGFEAHLTDRFFRYRNALELDWMSPIEFLIPFGKGEVRLDSDAGRINMLEAWVGIKLRTLGKTCTPMLLRVQYGIEVNRRGQSGWSRTNILGLEVAVRV